MKHKETVNDEAIKIASRTQRFLEKDDSPEMEDPEKYKRSKQIKSEVVGRLGRRQKKEAREDRAKNESLRKMIVNKLND
jgi:hypothetical protein